MPAYAAATTSGIPCHPVARASPPGRATRALALLAAILAAFAAGCGARNWPEAELELSVTPCPDGGRPRSAPGEEGRRVEWCELPAANGPPITHGLVLETFPGGRKRLALEVERNVAHGRIYGWWASGQPRFAGQYERGVRSGRWTTYEETGRPLYTIVFDPRGQPTTTRVGELTPDEVSALALAAQATKLLLILR